MSKLLNEIEINGSITVAELIKLLAKLPQDNIVVGQSGMLISLATYDDGETVILG